MSKIKTSASQFPNIYRLITENNIFKTAKNVWFRLPKQPKQRKLAILAIEIIFFLILLFLITSSVILAVNIYQKSAEFSNLISQRQKIQSEISFWQSVLQKYPGYKDAYLKIAILQYELKDYNSAKENNNKALLLDPNFEESRRLSELLSKK